MISMAQNHINLLHRNEHIYTAAVADSYNLRDCIERALTFKDRMGCADDQIESC